MSSKFLWIGIYVYFFYICTLYVRKNVFIDCFIRIIWINLNLQVYKNIFCWNKTRNKTPKKLWTHCETLFNLAAKVALHLHIKSVLRLTYGIYSSSDICNMKVNILQDNLFLQNLSTLLEESLQKKPFDLFHVHLRPQDS